MAAEHRHEFEIRSGKDVIKASTIISRLQPSLEKQYRIVITKLEEKRRSKQNRLSFMWYQDRASHTGNTIKYERCYCKLNHGIPILSADDPEFYSWYNGSIGRLAYEQQLSAVEHIDVTSLMSVKQFALYLTEIDVESTEMGAPLRHPDDLYFAALMQEK